MPLPLSVLHAFVKENSAGSFAGNAAVLQVSSYFCMTLSAVYLGNFGIVVFEGHAAFLVLVV